MIYLCNTFSVHMLPFLECGEERTVRFSRISVEQTRAILQGNAFRSFFGHFESARHLERYLKIRIPVCRGMIEMSENDVLIIAAAESIRKYEAGIKPCPGWRFYIAELAE